MKSRLLLLGALGSIVFFSACSMSGDSELATGPGESERMATYKIGVVTPLTGDAAVIGTQYQRVLDYRLEEVNSGLAEKNARIELIYEDGKCSGNEAVSAFQKLTTIDGVKVIFGSCSSETLAMAPLANANGVLLVSALSSSPEIDMAGDNVFSFSYSDEVVGKAITKELSKYGKVAMINEQNDYNVGVRDVVMSSLTSDGNTEVVQSEDFPKNQRDFRNTLVKIKESNPEAILLNPFPGVTAASLLKQLSEDEYWNDVQLISHLAYISGESREVSEEVTEGMVILDAPGVSDDSFNSLVANIVEQKGTVSDLGNYYVASAIDSLDIVSELLVQEQGDPMQVVQALRNGTFSGFTGQALQFMTSNFVSGVGAARYEIENGEAILTVE